VTGWLGVVLRLLPLIKIKTVSNLGLVEWRLALSNVEFLGEGIVKKRALLALPVALCLLAGCGGSGGDGGGASDSGTIYTDHSNYASSPPAINTSARSSAPPFGNYPVNYRETVRTTCSDGSCQTIK
jgi:hypothetical protein